MPLYKEPMRNRHPGLFTSELGSLTGHNVVSASRRRFIWKHDSASKYRDWGIRVPSLMIIEK